MLIGEDKLHPLRGAEAVLAEILRWLLRWSLRLLCSPRMPIALQRFGGRQVARLSRFPGGACVRRDTVAGVPGEWVQSRQAPPFDEAETTILYLHGGAFCVGSRFTHRSVTGYLALATGRPLFVAEYRLAPEHPYPAALDDCVAVYRALRARGPVIIAGDSAGGGLTLATTLALRNAKLCPPEALILFSPWVDLSQARAAGSEPCGEAMLSVGWLDACARHYLNGNDPRDPLVSPLLGDLRGLPPTLIQAGTDELLAAEALRLHDALHDAGVDVTCEIYSGRWHVFQFHAGFLPSATAALERAQDFLALRLPQRSAYQAVVNR